MNAVLTDERLLALAAEHAPWVPKAAGLPTSPGDYLVMLAENNDWELRSTAPIMVEFGAYKSMPQSFTYGDSGWHTSPEDITEAITFWTPMLAVPGTAISFQQRVQPWMMECFGPVIAGDPEERNHRFFEEATELVQACGMTASEAHQLVDYVYGRPVGQRFQEVGGAMVTLAALCLANELNMHYAGEAELARISVPETVAKIRAKQAAKPKHSPLPAPLEPGCSCEACRPITLTDMRMVLCETCGNKHCPHAADHRNACAGSNDPGQPASSYPVHVKAPKPVAWKTSHPAVCVPITEDRAVAEQWRANGWAVDEWFDARGFRLRIEAWKGARDALEAGESLRGGIFVGTYTEIEDALDKAGAPMQDGARWLSFPERIAALVAPAVTALGDELESHKRMLAAACSDLGAIHEALGLDPEEAGGAAPILEAIEALKAPAAARPDECPTCGETGPDVCSTCQSDSPYALCTRAAGSQAAASAKLSNRP